jgi:NTP pyrophosphatase (non-canonical NTP hydrolase)
VGQVDRPLRSGSLRLLQVDHKRWLEHNFPEQTREQIMLGMTEELGELAHHLLKREQGIRGGDVDHDAEIRDACADLVIFMCGLADLEDFDLMDAILEAWDQVRRRDWVEFPINGVDQ